MNAAANGGIELEGVAKFFTRPLVSGGREWFPALASVHASIETSQFVSVIGPSGCGKTTLLRMIAGLEPPDSGRVVVGGREVHGPGPERAMVFQQHSLLPWADVLTNIAFGLKLRGISKPDRIERARGLVELVGLKGFEHAYPRQLSGGMQQRVGLARALAVDPSYLLMDEPFGSLDEISRRSMQNELIRIWERDQKTAVFVTHNVDEAVILSDRILVMSASPGRVVQDITVALPRPRSRALESSKEFVDLRSGIWAALGL